MKEEKALYNATVCFLVKDNKILLGLKTKKIGEGCWNGYGGGIEDGESAVEAAVRELKEETSGKEAGGIIALPEHLEKIAIVDFHNTKSDGKTFVCRVHFYLVKQWKGEAQETEEMIKPTWFGIDELPFEKMMPADKIWLPIALSGKSIVAKARYGPFQKELIGDVEINWVESFPEDWPAYF